MERYAGGDDSAFREIYDAVAPRLLAYALLSLGDHMRAEDIVQQTFLAMHRARGSFERRSAVLPWAYEIARNLVADEWRRQKRDRRWVRVDPQAFQTPPPRPDEEAAARESAATLQLAFDALPESQKTVLCLRDEGKSQAEMAETLATTVTAVKLRVHRAGTTLRGALVKQELPR